MTSNPKPSTLSRRGNVVLMALFGLFLWLPTLDTIFHFDWTRPMDENRAPHYWPKTPADWRSWQAYPSALEAYFNDHFGCRQCLVQWQSKLNWSIFREKQAHDTLVGKAGWFFLTTDQMIDHYTGEIQLTDGQLRDWQRLLEKRRDWLARQGIDYLFVIAPNKETIYPEYLPDWLKKVRPETMADQFYNYLRTHSTVRVLDLRDGLLAAKKTRPVYLKTDEHWNNYGGFVAYQEIMRALAGFRPGLRPLPLDSFVLTNQLEPGVAKWWRTNQYWLAPLVLTNQILPDTDLTRSLGLKLPETAACFLSPKMGPPPFTTTLGPLTHYDVPWSTFNSQAAGRIMFFRDSFGTALVQFFGYHFNRVTYVRQHPLDPAAISREKPQIVISEMVERTFDTTDPVKLMAKDGLN